MAGGGSGGSGQSMLGGLMSNITGKGGWQGIADPLGIVAVKPPPEQPFLDQQQGMPSPMTPQDTDRLAFLKAFGVQG